MGYCNSAKIKNKPKLEGSNYIRRSKKSQKLQVNAILWYCESVVASIVQASSLLLHDDTMWRLKIASSLTWRSARVAPGFSGLSFIPHEQVKIFNWHVKYPLQHTGQRTPLCLLDIFWKWSISACKPLDSYSWIDSNSSWRSSFFTSSITNM